MVTLSAQVASSEYIITALLVAKTTSDATTILLVEPCPSNDGLASSLPLISDAT